MCMTIKDAIVYHCHTPGLSPQKKALAKRALVKLYEVFTTLARSSAHKAKFRTRMQAMEWEDVVHDLLVESRRLPNLQMKLQEGIVIFATEDNANNYLHGMLDFEALDYLKKRDKHPQVEQQAHTGIATQEYIEEPLPSLDEVRALLDRLTELAAKDTTRRDARRTILTHVPLLWQLKLKQVTSKQLAKQMSCSLDALFKRCERVRQALSDALVQHTDSFSEGEQFYLRNLIQHLARRQTT